MKTLVSKLFVIGLCTSFAFVHANECRSLAAPMVRGDTASTNQGWTTKALVTTGEKGNNGFNFNPTNFNYNPVGIFDGIGVFKTEPSRLNAFTNHEVPAGFGLPYSLQNKTVMTGARIDRWDMNFNRWCVLSGTLAYDTIYDREGVKLKDPQQLNKGREESVAFAVAINQGFQYNGGFTLFCSGGTFDASQGFDDQLYFAGEEQFQGQGTVTDIKHNTLYVVPMLGQIAFENTVPLNNFNSDKVVLLIGQDDGAPAPLWVYVGEKKTKPPAHSAYKPPNFLVKNGLGFGRLYAWVPNNPNFHNENDFGGTGNTAEGKFVYVKQFDPTKENQPGYDNLGFLKGTSFPDAVSQQFGPLQSLAFSQGAFAFARPEDLSPNPADTSRAVFAVTGGNGRPTVLGRLYIVELTGNASTKINLAIDNIDEFEANLTVLYDSADGGGGQFPNPLNGIRSPDNLTWATNGYVYVQEDITSSSFCNGTQNSVWQVSPITGQALRILEIDRSAVPQGQIDVAPPTACTAWESSGVLDISDLVRNPDNRPVLLLDVQAHSIIASNPPGLFDLTKLVEGSQLLVAFGPQNSEKIDPSEKSRLKPTNFIPKKTKEKKMSQERWLRKLFGRSIKRKDLLDEAVKTCLDKLNFK